MQSNNKHDYMDITTMFCDDMSGSYFSMQTKKILLKGQEKSSNTFLKTDTCPKYVKLSSNGLMWEAKFFVTSDALLETNWKQSPQTRLT